jgi:hypothetical protein
MVETHIGNGPRAHCYNLVTDVEGALAMENDPICDEVPQRKQMPSTHLLCIVACVWCACDCRLYSMYVCLRDLDLASCTLLLFSVCGGNEILILSCI